MAIKVIAYRPKWKVLHRARGGGVLLLPSPDKFYQTGTKASHQPCCQANSAACSPDAPLEIAANFTGKYHQKNISKKADSVNPIGQSSNIVPLLTFVLLLALRNRSYQQSN